MGTHYTGKTKFMGTNSSSRTLDSVRRHRLFRYTLQLYELTSLWCFFPCCLLLQKRKAPNYTKWDKQHLNCCLCNKPNCVSICRWKTENMVLTTQHENSASAHSACHTWCKVSEQKVQEEQKQCVSPLELAGRPALAQQRDSRYACCCLRDVLASIWHNTLAALHCM